MNCSFYILEKSLNDVVYLIKKIIDELTVINSHLKELNNLKWNSALKRGLILYYRFNPLSFLYCDW